VSFGSIEPANNIAFGHDHSLTFDVRGLGSLIVASSASMKALCLARHRSADGRSEQMIISGHSPNLGTPRRFRNIWRPVVAQKAAITLEPSKWQGKPINDREGAGGSSKRGNGNEAG
jgi:hypothetical protein